MAAALASDSAMTTATAKWEEDCLLERLLQWQVKYLYMCWFKYLKSFWCQTAFRFFKRLLFGSIWHFVWSGRGVYFALWSFGSLHYFICQLMYWLDENAIILPYWVYNCSFWETELHLFFVNCKGTFCKACLPNSCQPHNSTQNLTQRIFDDSLTCKCKLHNVW